MLGKEQFHVGQKVYPSAEGIEARLFWRVRKKLKTLSGVVKKVDEHGCPTVLWNYRKTASTYHPSFVASKRAPLKVEEGNG